MPLSFAESSPERPVARRGDPTSINNSPHLFKSSVPETKARISNYKLILFPQYG
jgi:hypothetical protein